MPRTVIVIPCYNEAARLDVGSFERFAAQHDDIQFLFSDDGSTDATPQILARLHGGSPDKFLVHRLERNSGKAEAVRQGMLTACESSPRPEYVGFWDADLATPLEDIPTFAQLLNQRPDIQMIFGSRVNLLGRRVRRKLMRHYIGRVFATGAAFMLGLPIYDTQCGAKLFRVTDHFINLIREPFLSKWIFDVEIIAREVQARRNGSLPHARQVIYEHPLMIWNDVAGSKLKLRDFFTVGMDLVRIRRKYLRGRPLTAWLKEP